MERSRILTVALIGSLLLEGCSLMRTHYTRPQVNVPNTFAHADESAKASLERWWESFHDSNLSALIDKALREDNDLALAALNVRASERQMHLAAIHPIVAVRYSYSYSKSLKH